MGKAITNAARPLYTLSLAWHRLRGIPHPSSPEPSASMSVDNYPRSYRPIVTSARCHLVRASCDILFPLKSVTSSRHMLHHSSHSPHHHRPRRHIHIHGGGPSAHMVSSSVACHPSPIPTPSAALLSAPSTTICSSTFSKPPPCSPKSVYVLADFVMHHSIEDSRHNTNTLS